MRNSSAKRPTCHWRVLALVGRKLLGYSSLQSFVFSAKNAQRLTTGVQRVFAACTK
jgi:hypothetical protein